MKISPLSWPLFRRLRLRGVGLTLIVLFLFPQLARAQTPQCIPETGPDRQQRSEKKHGNPRPRPRATWVSVRDVTRWLVPFGVEDARFRLSPTAIHPLEKKAFNLAGDLWRVKVDDADCDIHMEISMPGAARDAPRVIAEIPNDEPFSRARRVILAEIARLKEERVIRSNGEVETPVRVSVTGLAFYDGSHYTRADPVKGNAHGSEAVATLWELHPVWAAKIERRSR
jgi:hypothetical protein